jgi:hypothetical protein
MASASWVVTVARVLRSDLVPTTMTENGVDCPCSEIKLAQLCKQERNSSFECDSGINNKIPLRLAKYTRAILAVLDKRIR